MKARPDDTPPTSPNGRRSFLGKSLFGIALLPSLANMGKWFGGEKPASEAASTDLFICESGIYGLHDKFVIGALEPGKPNQAAQAMQNLRDNLRYRSVLSYNSRDKYKKDYAEALIDLFVSGDFLFTAYIVSSEEYHQLNRPSKSQKQAKKTQLYQELFGKHKGKGWQKVQVKSQSAYGPGEKFKQKFKGATGKDIAAAHTMDSDLLQFAGFLTGHVFAEINGQPVRNRTKQALHAYLKERLGVESLAEGKTDKFEVYSKI
jgi:hypothetical protein